MRHIAAHPFAAAGALLVVVTSAAGSGFSPMAIPFVLWALAPYGFLVMVERQWTNRWATGGAGAAAVTVEAGIRAAVFLYPRGSTAAVVLVFSPVYIAAIVMPFGALAGAAFGWAFARSGQLVRVPLAVLAVAILALTWIGFARPELFPTAVVARRAALESIGEPRVVTGAGAFTRRVVSERSGWHQAGDFDGQPGDEIAVIDHTGAELLDPSDSTVLAHVPFGGEPGRLWNWYSRLHLIDGRPVVVQTGGGYQDTEVRALDNTLLWSYHPDKDLPPSALLPADLDGDGQTEFYAATTRYVARLDAAGREVWTRPLSLAGILDLRAATATEPSWVVAGQYGGRVRVWDAAGTPIGEAAWPSGASITGVVHWPDARRLAVSTTPAVALRLDGDRIEIPLGEDMTLAQAVAFRWTADAAPTLAVVAAAPRDVNRWRLRLLNAAREVVYDEILGRAVLLHVAMDAAGRSTLLVGGAGLSAITPVDP